MANWWQCGGPRAASVGADGTDEPLAGKEDAPSYWLTRFVILRLLGLVYFIAFLVTTQQIVPLIGGNGLFPAKSFLHQIESRLGSRWTAFVQLPGIFWFGVSDKFMVAVACAGVALSMIVLLGYANA